MVDIYCKLYANWSHLQVFAHSEFVVSFCHSQHGKMIDKSLKFKIPVDKHGELP